MKKTFLKIVTILGFKRKKPKTKFGRVLRRCENVLIVVAILYLLILVYPQPLFAHAFKHQGISVYSRQPIPQKEAEALLSQIRARIRASDICEEKKTFRIFLCNNKSLYTLFSPSCRDSFGNTPITGNIILASVDLSSDTATAFRSDNNERSFVGVASHEICHVMMRRAFGLWSAYRAPTWLKEGYCEHISGESSFSEEKGDDLLSQGKEAEGNSFKYFVYRRMVDFCLTEQYHDIIELFSNPPSEQEVRNQTQKWVAQETSNNSMQAMPNGA